MVDENKLHLEKLLDSGDSSKVTNTLLYISYNISDVEWAREELMRMENDPDDEISGLALTCLGHLARVNGRINKYTVIPFLKDKMASSNEIVSSRAEDALDDINMFT